MIRKIILLPVFLMLLASCSSDNNDTDLIEEEEVQELKISKFSETIFYENSEPRKIDYFFNENGQLFRENLEYIVGNIPAYFSYIYDNFGKIIKVEHYSNEDVFLGIRSYEYNDSNKLTKVTSNLFFPTIRTSNFSYEGTTINFLEEETNTNGSFIFDNENNLLSISGTNYSQNISYSGSNVSQINYQNQENIIYEYADGVNPLNELFTNDINTYILGNTISYFNFSESDNFFSSNIITKITNEVYNYTETREIEYNSEGYPTTINGLRDSFHKKLQFFEYY